MRIRTISVAFLTLMLLVTTHVMAASSDNGKTLFQSHCSSCHMINQRLVGPALQGINDKQSESWIISFVHSPSKKISSGDTAAAGIYKTFQPIMMPDQGDLKDDDIRDIIAYIKSQSQPVATVASINAPAVSLPPAQSPLTWTSYYFWSGVACILVLLVAIFSTLINATNIKRQYANSK